MKWKRLGYMLGIVIPTIAGLVPVPAARAQSIELPIDFTVNVKNYLNVKNGIAGLDANAEFPGGVSGTITDSSFVNALYTATSVRIITGGAKYAVGDIIYDDHGGRETVTSVDSYGGVTGLAIPASVVLASSDYNDLRRPRSTSGSGYNLAFTYVASSTPVKNALTQYPYFTKFLNSKGLKFDGTDTDTAITSVFSGLADHDAYDVDSSFGSLDVSKSGFQGKKDYVIRDYKHGSNYYGDGSMLDTVDQGITHRRYVEQNTDWVASDFFDYHYAYTGAYPPENQHNIWVQSTLGKDHLGNTIDSRGHVIGIGSDMTSYSRGDASNFDTNAVFTNYRHGTDWQWANLSVIQEFAPDPLIAHNTQEWLGEWDWGGWGEDGGPNNSSRHSLMITGWQVGGGYNHDWAANSTYSIGDQIQVSINGVLCSVVATTKGTTGNTVPDWSAHMGNSESKFSKMNLDSLETITDGTVVWRYNGTMRMVIANAMDVSYQPDNSHGQDADLPANSYGTRTTMQYHSFLKTDAVFDTAILDFASAQWPLNSTAVWARVPKDFYIDMNATYNSTSTNNRNLFGYDSSTSSLTYKYQGNSVFSVSDDGTVSANRINTNDESHFSLGIFSDPDTGTPRDAKFGNRGIAVSGGIKTDTINVTGALTSPVSIPTSPTQTLSTIQAAGYTTAGTQTWCGTCRAPGEATGTGTGRYVYLNSKGVWKTLDGIDASE